MEQFDGYSMKQIRDEFRKEAAKIEAAKARQLEICEEVLRRVDAGQLD